MMNMSLNGQFIMTFVTCMCKEHKLTEEQSLTLKQMIDKMCNFCVDSPQAEVSFYYIIYYQKN